MQGEKEKEENGLKAKSKKEKKGIKTRKHMKEKRGNKSTGSRI